jgi:colanic acid biosynthesis glycosyl transferase WcaI
MNLLVVCPHYAPDVAPTGEVMTSIVTELARRGHRLHVVTALPWYRGHRVEEGWTGRWIRTDETDFGWITRLHPFPTDKSNIPARALAFGGFTALTMLAGLRPKVRPDAVLVMSPPLILGISGWLLARRWRVPLVFNIQDVFPDVAIEVGAITSPKVITTARWLERFLYRRSDAVTVLSDDLRANLAAKLAGHRPERVEVIPNFVDTDRVRPLPSRNSYREEFGLGDRVVVMYAGNLGFSQSVDLLLDAALDLRSDPDVVFVVNGGGSARAQLVERARGLDNVVFVGMQPKDRLAEVLAAADIHTVLLKEGLARSSVPSKLYSILAAGRPCVASVDLGTEVARTLESADAGVAVPPDDAEAFTKAVRRLVADRTERERLGSNGRRWVEHWLSAAAVAERYEQLFEGLAAGHGRR